MSSSDIVITGIGAVTAGAVGRVAHWDLLQNGRVTTSENDYSLKLFRPDSHVKDRRYLRSCSQADGIGLAALSGLMTDSNFDPKYYSPERVGIYTGESPPNPQDHSGHFEALEASRDEHGHISEKVFGQASRSARPVTLLLGLSNNVLCYGSLMWDARGPNSNYTSSVLSAHLAVINAAKRMQRGALDLAIAGGCSDSTEEFRKATLIATNIAAGYAKGTAVADGAAFITLERRKAALARGSRILASYISSAYSCDGLGPARFDRDGNALYDCIVRALSAAAVNPAEIGLIFSGSSGLPDLDLMETQVLGRVFAGAATPPALADTSRVLGGLMEAGGMLDLGLVSEFFTCGVVPPAVRPHVNRGQFSNHISPERPFALALRCSTSGEYSCVIVKGELN